MSLDLSNTVTMTKSLKKYTEWSKKADLIYFLL